MNKKRRIVHSNINAKYIQLLTSLSSEERIQWAVEKWPGRVIVTTSFGQTAGILLHLAAKISPGIRVITIRHGHESMRTLELAKHFENTLPIDLCTYNAPRLTVPHEQDPGFLEYCRKVKVETMREALRHERPSVWIAGLIHDETRARNRLPMLTYRFGVRALYPILDWTSIQAIDYCLSKKIPMNEDYRDPCKGPDQKHECGLHVDRS